MNQTPQPEPWLRGPLEGFEPLLMPAAHALVQAAADVDEATRGLTPQQLWSKPGGAPSIGFHLRHIAGSIDRLLTYSRNETLSRAQLEALANEGVPGDPPSQAAALIAAATARIEETLEVLRTTSSETLLEPRTVGRAKLPSNVIGLLFHIAEHTQRHTGQTVTTAKIVRRFYTLAEASR